MKGRITWIFFISCLLIFSARLQAQDLAITGTVISQTDGGPLPGVTVAIQGTNRGTTTSGTGEFRINAPVGAKLTFSLIGMQSQTVNVSNASPLRISLADDVSALEEVVVVGYGTQKKSVVTGAITSVKASQLETMPVNRIEQSLQGRTSGLTIASNSGQPGEAATVRLRGITSLRADASNPLWVVDGIVVDNGGISYLNQSDIESIDVLKDAASQAIYGTRAAAGVILVTTKKGKAGGIQLNYTGYYGTSAPARKLSLLNATQYATLRNEAAAADGSALPFANPESYGEGTDWQDAVFNNNAQRQNHEFNISGGGEKSKFYTSFGYLDQEGIVATDISKYKRVNIRLNSEHKPTKWLTIGQNLGYAHNKSIGLGTQNSEFGGVLSSAINLDPITPLVETDPMKASGSPYSPSGANYNGVGIRRNVFGYPYGISPYVGQEMANPLALISTRLGNYSWGDNIIGNAYAEIAPLKGLIVRSSFGGKLAFWGTESYTPVFFLNTSTSNPDTQFFRENNNRLDWNLTNTVSYTKSIQKHSFTALLGQEAYLENRTRMNNVRFDGIPADNFEEASFNTKVPVDQRISDASEGQEHTVSSLFMRLNYNYDEKYLIEGVIRRDGSSRFGSNNKYGVFPSFGLGWVPVKEDFWPQNDVVNFLKIRGSYGVVGNDNIGDFAYVSTIGSGRNAAIGTDSYYIGYSPNAPANPDLRWEETRSVNIGFESILFNDFTLTFDWYKKSTIDILDNPRIPFYVGAISNPAANVGDMYNTGLEFELGWNKKIGEVQFGANGNFSTLKNKVTYLGENKLFLEQGQQSFQNLTTSFTRTAVGHAINSYYGYQTLGIFQTQDEINNYLGAKGIIQPNAKPGDFKWADNDGDGDIDTDDRAFLGSPLPKYTFGLTLNAAWKGFDAMVFGQGVAGNKIFQGLRRFGITEANWQTEALGRWVGEGTSTEYPRLSNTDPNANFRNPSDYYLKDGSYFRIKVIQLGYSLPKNLISKAGLRKARVYVMSENLVTFTKYSGYDPEIGGGVMSIDRGFYPQSRSFFVGLNVGL